MALTPRLNTTTGVVSLNRGLIDILGFVAPLLRHFPQVFHKYGHKCI